MSSSVPAPATVLEVFDALDSPGTPLTTPEVAEEFDCAHRTIYNKLDALVDDGALETKKVGARGRVWWRPPGVRADGEEHNSEVTLEENADRTRQDRLLEEQKRLVEVIASGAPLEECLSSLCTTVSTLDPTTRASIVLTDDEHKSFERCIAPDLSPAWREELEGLPIDDSQIGACGEAVFHGDPVTCEDVKTDDRWSDDWRELCLANDVLAGHSVPIHDEDGEPLGSFMLCFDEPRTPTEWEQLSEFGTHVASIALERERSNRVLRESEERLRLATGAAEMGVWELDLQTEESPNCSPRHDEIFGYEEPREDWGFERFLDHVHPEDREWVDQSFEGAFETGEWTFDCRIIRADDEQRWIAAQGEFYDDDDGEPVRAVGTVEDITERKEHERRLARQREQFEQLKNSLLETSPTGILLVDETGEITLANDRAAEILGESAEELTGRSHTAPEFEFVDQNEKPLPDAELPSEQVRTTGEPVFGVEVGATRHNGQRIWLSMNAAPLDDDQADEQTEIVVALEDITERKETEEALRESEERFRALVTTTSDVVYSMSPDWSEMHELEGGGFLTDTDEPSQTWVDKYIPDDDRPRVQDAIDEAIRTKSIFELEHRVIQEDGTVGWTVSRATPLLDDEGEITQWFGVANDITERKQQIEALERREQNLSELNTTTRNLMEADAQEINDRAAEITQEIRDVAVAALWRYDDEAGDLRRETSRTAQGIEQDAIRYPERFEERAWQTFISNEMDVDNDLSPVPESTESEESICSGVIVPLGRHGIIWAGSVNPNTFGETTVDLAETVAANVEAALDRADREGELETRADELTHLDRINSVIRTIDQALVQADTRAEIDRVVCDRLAASDLYEFAWIGEHDGVTDTIEPQEWAGVDSGYVDDLTITTDDAPTGRGPVGTAARTRETQIVEEIATDARFAPWREQTLEQGVRSCISIPLVYDETLYGVLSVYATTPTFSGNDRAVLDELGETIAHAINAIETKETMHSDSVVELTLGIQPSNSILGRLAQNAACRIEFEGFVLQRDDSSNVFFTAHDTMPDEIRAAGEDSVAVDELTWITDRDDGSLFKARVSDSTLPSLFVEQDAVVRTLTFESDEATAIVNLSSTETVREFIETIQTTYPDTELLSRRTRERAIQTPHEFKTAVEDGLTARQQEILRTAYLSGFFQSPRESTGQDIAGLLDVSQTTFTHHLRAGQHNLFELLFEEA